MGFNIFEPRISTVTPDLRGKTFLIYGGNSTGKTLNLTKFPRPLFFAFEYGLNALGNVANFPIVKWKDFVDLFKQITAPANQQKLAQQYDTVVIDTLEQMAARCEEYICTTHNIRTLGDKPSKPDGTPDESFNGYTVFGKEIRRYIDPLLNLGFAVGFISHEGVREVEVEDGKGGKRKIKKLYPTGDKRLVDPIVNAVDVIGYAKINGVDDSGHEIPSSLYLRNTDEYLARSRFTDMPEKLEVFSADALRDALMNAVRTDGSSDFVSYEEQVESRQVPKDDLSFDELKASIGAVAMKLHEAGRIAEYTAIVTKHWGVGKTVKEAGPAQQQVLEVIWSDLKELAV